MLKRSIFFLFIFALSTTLFAQTEGWNQWRGPNQLGVTDVKNLPVKWDDGQNIAWKTELPGPGASQPVLWEDKIYVASFSGYTPGGMELGTTRTASTMKFHVNSVDMNHGEILWETVLEPMNPIDQNARNVAHHGFATPTPYVDAERLYVSFGTGGVFCFDHAGKEIWRKSIGKDNPDWGYAASVVSYKNLLIVNACVESGRMIALDKTTGEEVWSFTLGLGQGMNQISRSTPLIFKNAEGQWRLAFIAAGQNLQVHDPATGDLVWQQGRFSGGYASNTPIVNEDGSVLYCFAGGSHGEVEAQAYRTGDNVSDRLIWQHKRRGTALVPPVLYKGRLYYSAHGGVKPQPAVGFGCLDPETGEVIYHVNPKDMDSDNVYAPTLAGDGKIYYQSQLNGTWVVEASDEFKVLSVNVLDEDKVSTQMKMNSRRTGNESGNGFVSMPVPLADGRLLLRGFWGLYCVNSAQ